MVADTELKSTSDLQAFFIKFSMIRLGIMFFLLILAIAEILNLSDRGLRLNYYRDIQYIFFFILGFSFNILYILITRKYIASKFVFRFQFVVDFLFTTWWVVLTGGSFSGFSFIYVLSLFSYGKILGFKTVFLSSIFIWITVFLISCIQFYYPFYWGEEHIRGSDLAYNYSLLTLAFVLVNFLVKMNRMEEKRLLYKVIEQERALQKEEELRFRIFDWLDAGLIVVDSDGKIQMVNKKALDWVSGNDRDSVLGVPFYKFFPEFLNHWNNRDVVSFRRNTVARDGEVIFGFKMTQLPEDQGWMILFTDITDFQKMEKQIKEMEKMATVGELAAGLAHEMKNPLAGIKTSLQLLVSDDLEKHYFDRLSKVVLRDIDRLDYLLKDFLIFAKPKSPDQEYFLLSDEIESILMPLKIQYKNVKIKVKLGEEPYLFDKNQFHQIMINVLINSFQALENSDSPEIEIYESWESQTRKIIVSDNGPGISPEIIEKCFDPFITSKSVGSGLGLAIARRLAAQNGAYLELRNNTTKGAMAILSTTGNFFRPNDNQVNL